MDGLSLNYAHLRYFRAVARDGNLTRAAQGLRLSQSALSTQIRTLEERLGHDLFERRGRALHLTEAGRIALDHADVIFAAGDDLVATLGRTGGARPALRVGALSTLSRNVQMTFLRPLLGREDVELVLRSATQSELLPALASLSLDVVLTNLRPGPEAVPGLVAHRIAEQPVALVGSPRRPAACRPPRAAPDRNGKRNATRDAIRDGAALRDLLAAHPVVLPTPGNGIRAEFDSLAARLDVRPRIAAEVDDMAMIRLLAREDVGLAVVPPIVVRDEIAAGLLAEAPYPLDAVETFYALTVPRRFPNPLLDVVLPQAGAS